MSGEAEARAAGALAPSLLAAGRGAAAAGTRALRALLKTPNVAPAICTPCGGACCKGDPGSYLPAQLGPDLRGELARRLRLGRHIVEETASGALVVRPRGADDGRGSVGQRYGGECTFLTVDGCSLSYPSRPAQCMGLTPKPDRECRQRSPLKRLAVELSWAQHREAVSAVLAELATSPPNPEKES